MINQKVLNRRAILDNLDKVRGKKVCAMVKSNAYGHGLEEIVSIIGNRVDYFGVVNFEEACRVENLSSKPILICSKQTNFKKLASKKFEVIIESSQDLLSALKFGLGDRLHLKIDCGMHRFGVSNPSELEKINEILENEKINLKSISTHFPLTDNKRITNKNYQNFLRLRSEISQNCPICFGGSNILNYDFNFDILRLGIGLYGYEGNWNKIVKIKSKVVKIEPVRRGEHFGYGTFGKAKKDSFLAVVPIGYGDGLRRNLSGKFYVTINDKKYKSVGRICMDCFFVEVDSSVKVGDEVIVMSDAEYFAKKLDTISYEILTGFSNLRGETIIVDN